MTENQIRRKGWRYYRSPEDISAHMTRCTEAWLKDAKRREQYPRFEDVAIMVLACAMQKPQAEFPCWPRSEKWGDDTVWKWWRFRAFGWVIQFAEFGIEPAIYRQIIGPRGEHIVCHRCHGNGNLYSTFSIHGRFCENCGGGGYETDIEAAKKPENQARWRKQRIEHFENNWRRWSRTGRWFSCWWNGGPA